MTPTSEQLKEMWEWYQARKVQQISYPLDDASKASLGVPTSEGPGSTTKTQVINTSGATATVPAAYVQTVLVRIDGTQYEFPSLI